MSENTFVTKTAAKIEEWKKEIMKFKVIAEVADPDPQITHYQIIEDIVAQEELVSEKLEAYRASDAVDRSALKNELEVLTQRVDESIEAARVKIN